MVIATGGRVEFWLLPNLTNDKLGVIESFKPLYSVKKKRKKEGKKGGKKEGTGSDLENSDQEETSDRGQTQQQEDEVQSQSQDQEGSNCNSGEDVSPGDGAVSPRCEDEQQ